MDIKNLYPFVILIILVGMVIGVGVFVTDKTGATVFYEVKDKNDSITPVNNTHVQLTFGNITSVKSVKLARTQQVIPSANYTIYANGSFLLTEIANDSSACTRCNLTINNTAVNVIYDAKNYATATRDAMKDVTTEVGNIASNWLGLIVTVAILSLILFYVVRSFSFGPKR